MNAGAAGAGSGSEAQRGVRRRRADGTVAGQLRRLRQSHTVQAGSKAEALQQLGQLGVWRLLTRLVKVTAGALSNGAS